MVLCIISLFVFSILYAQNKYDADTPQRLLHNQTYTTARIDTITPRNYRVFAIANQQELQPAQIYIPAGSAVDFYLTSNDESHGFTITKKNIHLTAGYGTINKTPVSFDTPGIYKIVCTDDNKATSEPVSAEIIVYHRLQASNQSIQ